MSITVKFQNTRDKKCHEAFRKQKQIRFRIALNSVPCRKVEINAFKM